MGKVKLEPAPPDFDFDDAKAFLLVEKFERGKATREACRERHQNAQRRYRMIGGTR